MTLGPFETSHGPKHSEDFEDMIRDLGLKMFPGYLVERYGSNGQSQHGVDVRAFRPRSQHKLFQCKRRESLSTIDMDKDLEEAEDYPFSKESYTFCTTLKRATKLQDHAAKLSEKYGLPVEIKFWDDIKDSVLKYEDLKKKYFHNYLIEIQTATSIHVEVNIWMSHYDFVVTKLPNKERFREDLLLVTSLQTKKACYYRLGDYHYNFIPVIGVGSMDAFLVWKWFEQFSSFEKMRASYTEKDFFVSDIEIREFQKSVSGPDADDE